MLELSRFYGIVVQVYYNDHPPVHFHPEIPAKSLEDFEAEIQRERSDGTLALLGNTGTQALGALDRV